MKTTWLQPHVAMASFMVMVLSLSGCATDAQRTRTEGAAAGAVIGGAAGRLIGGHKDGAIAGAILGGLAGVAIGDQVADKKARYTVQEDELRASAERAMSLARASQERNQQLTRDIAALDQSVQRLRSAKMSAESRRVLALENREKQRNLLSLVDGQLHQLREETSRQAALIKAAATPPAANGTVRPQSEGVRLVAASMRSMDQQAWALEQAKLDLQKIDQRRAY